MKNPFISVGYNKLEMDFEVGGIVDLTYEEMKELRDMICVAIGIAEEMWRNAQQRKDMPQQLSN